ncbi:DEAD/DEAH box helicase [Pseudomonas aeruginosa]
MALDISPNRRSRLQKLGFDETWRLIFNLPEDYDDFSVPTRSLSQVLSLEQKTRVYGCFLLKNVKNNKDVEAEKRARGETPKEAEIPYCIVELSDGHQSKNCMVFGKKPAENWQALAKDKRNKLIFVTGVIKHGTYQGRPTVDIDQLREVPVSEQGQIVARYKGKPDVISPATVGETTQLALIHESEIAVQQLCDAIGEDEGRIIKTCRLKFNNLKHLLMTLHQPKSAEDLQNALAGARRINAYAGLKSAQDATMRAPSPKAAVPVDRELIKTVVEEHPFTPTREQRQAIWDIVSDFSNKTPMDRLLSADVGNGKTMTYAIPAAYMARKGKNVVVLLPTEPLAAQIYNDIATWYPDLKCHLVISKFKQEVTQGSILVGTTAVNAWLKKHPDWKVDLAITDEQQKMGTLQRDEIAGPDTHILEATATPIPRTMAQTLFGNKKISFINESPVKKNIQTTLIGNTIPERRRALEKLDSLIAQGHKIAVIYPLVAEKSAHYFMIDCMASKEADKIAALLKKSGISVKSITSVGEAKELLEQLDVKLEEEKQDRGFVVELHAEDQALEKLQGRFDKVLGEHASKVSYLGSLEDEELVKKNKATIERGVQVWESRFPGKVACIHGRSKREHKLSIIEEMNSGKYSVLIATTLLEIGVTVKGLMGVLVVGAEGMGAFTLHQLRGRNARQGGDGFFIMMVNRPLEELSEEAKDRLNLLVKYTSGADIALYSMEQQGFGDLRAGGKNQKGFEAGIFPSVKVIHTELENFLSELSQEMYASKGLAQAEPGCA